MIKFYHWRYKHYPYRVVMHEYGDGSFKYVVQCHNSGEYWGWSGIHSFKTLKEAVDFAAKNSSIDKATSLKHTTIIE